MNLVFQFAETSLGLYINFNPILKKKKKIFYSEIIKRQGGKSIQFFSVIQGKSHANSKRESP